jgi:DNA replication protein DnaC
MDTNKKMTSFGRFTSLVVNNRQIPPRLESFVFWTRVFRGEIEEYDWMPALLQKNGYIFPGSHYRFISAAMTAFQTSFCPFCKGAGTRFDERHGYYYCLCKLLAMRSDMQIASEKYQSHWAITSMDTIIPVGKTRDEILSVATMKTAVSEWIVNPTKGMVLSGPTGVGKSHALQAIVTAWSPFAAYLTANDFEGKLREYYGEERRDEESIGKIQIFLNWAKNIPILCLDDLGIQYATAWIQKSMDNLIESRFRSAIWRDRLTVVGTNLRMGEIRERTSVEGVPRIGSRLTSTEQVLWINVQGSDYRNKA